MIFRFGRTEKTVMYWRKSATWIRDANPQIKLLLSFVYAYILHLNHMASISSSAM